MKKSIRTLGGRTLCLPAGSVVFLGLISMAFLACSHKNAPTSAKEAGPGCVSENGVSCGSQTQSSTANASQADIVPFFESVSDGNLDDFAITTKIIGEEVEKQINESAEKEGVPEFDIPIVLNAKVEKWLNWFQGRKGRRVMERWMARSGKYIPMFKTILRENGLPQDLVYLAMIESGFKPYAYSHARASGPWQFIRGTGRRYGLRVNWWIDERRDPEKSTIAAAQHLKDLYDQFNDWYLAAAGYNAGAGKIENAMRRYSTEDFWEMSKSKYRYLKRETKNYVPKIIAAALVAKNPAQYGFTDIKYQEPLQYDKVLVPEPTELRVIASALGISRQALQELNPELRRGITPPNTPNYELRVPKDYQDRFIAAYPKIKKDSASGARKHVVRRGDSLWDISRAYGTSIQAIKSFNRMKSTRLRPGQQLAIPTYGQSVRAGVARPAVYKKKVSSKKGTYRVRRGDTLWSISRRFGVSVREIRKWNNIRSAYSLRPGQRLRLNARTDPPMLQPSKTASIGGDGQWKTHRVRRGENLSRIAKRYGVRVSDLTQWNDLNPKETIYPGLKLKIRQINL